MDAVVYHERGVGVSEKLLQSVSDVEQSALIDLWEIDLRPLGGELLWSAWLRGYPIVYSPIQKNRERSFA